MLNASFAWVHGHLLIESCPIIECRASHIIGFLLRLHATLVLINCLICAQIINIALISLIMRIKLLRSAWCIRVESNCRRWKEEMMRLFKLGEACVWTYLKLARHIDTSVFSNREVSTWKESPWSFLGPNLLPAYRAFPTYLPKWSSSWHLELWV